MLHTVIFIGRSGCGKGTQAKLLMDNIHDEDTEKRKILYVETGEWFRRFIRSTGYSSEISAKIYDKDDRQPDFLAVVSWGQTLLEEMNPDQHLVFDGTPRSEPEAKMLTTAIKFYKRESPTVIYIDVSREWSEKRLLSRGRLDDVSLDKIDKRLDWFDRDVIPAINYFKSDPSYRVITVNGEQSVDAVHSELKAKYQSGN